MRQITIADLDHIPFSLHHIAAVNMIPRKPSYTSLPGGRLLSCLFYIVSGACSFSWENGEVRMDAGCLGYLPQGSVHLYRTLTPEIRYIRLDFQLQSPEDGEFLIFSQHPMVLLSNPSSELTRMLYEISVTCQSLAPGNNLSVHGQLARIFAQLFAQVSDQKFSGTNRRLLPALQFLQNYPEQDVPTESLASMCGLSVTQLRRLFHSCTGMTVTEYKTQLRIRRACHLLCEGELSIGEIADRLGYENIFYFSRVFKKVIGISPKQYQNDKFI